MPSPAESAAPPAVDWAARRRGPVGLVAPGRYTAGGVTVSRRAVDGDLAVTLPAPSVQTPHFRVHQLPAGVVVQHDLHPGEIDNDLATHITAELFGRGPFRAAEDFEHCLVGLVVTSAEDPLEAWLRFYRNTLRRLAPAVRRSVRALSRTSPTSTPLLPHCSPGAPPSMSAAVSGS